MTRRSGDSPLTLQSPRVGERERPGVLGDALQEALPQRRPADLRGALEEPRARRLDHLRGALALAGGAQAAAPSCLRGGASLVAAGGSVRIVSVKEKPSKNVTRQARMYGCWAPTGRRFTLLIERDFGDDLIQRTTFQIVGGRYVGAYEDFEGGVSESFSAETWDALKHVKLHDSKPCDSKDRGDASGPDDVAFLPRGALAYSCNELHIADANGDRLLEPAGTDVRNLAVTTTANSFNARLYWLVVAGNTQTPESLELT